MITFYTSKVRDLDFSALNKFQTYCPRELTEQTNSEQGWRTIEDIEDEPDLKRMVDRLEEKVSLKAKNNGKYMVSALDQMVA